MLRRILVPGIGDSGPGHWQTLWQRDDARFERVVVRDFLEPDRDEWVAAIEQLVCMRDGPCVLIGHSLGCGTIAHWAQSGSHARAAGVVLVGPSDIAALPYREDVETFLPLPLDPLPFPSLVVASSTDPYVPLPRAQEFARAWGSEFVAIGPAGHINAEAGYGPWPEGRALLDAFVRRLERAPR